MRAAFPISCRVPFEDYVKMLFRQSPFGGDGTKWQSRSASTHLHVAQRVFDQAVERERENEIDGAYVMFCRVLHILESAKPFAVGSDKAKLIELLREALQREENLRLKRLPLFLEEQVSLLEESEAERKRIVLLQMEKESSDEDDEEEARHNERREKLLGKSESAPSLAFPIVVDDSFHTLRQQQLRTQEQTEAAKLRSLLSSTETKTPANTILPISVIAPATPLPVMPSAPVPSAQVCVPTIPKITSSKPVCLRRQWSFERGESNHFRRGLVNLGNTCYLNSTLQCLAQTELGAFVITEDFEELTARPSNLLESFSFAMRELSQATRVPVNASRLKLELGKLNESFAGKSQQDANELLRTLLDGIHEELNTKRGVKLVLPEIDNHSGSDDELANQHWAQYKARNASLIVSLFAFQERSNLCCPRCKFISRSFSPTLGIDVPIPLGNDVSVEDCLAAYCKDETVDGLITCSNCNQKVAARKQLSLHTTPRNLVITLKRFRSQGNFADKIQSPVFFQETIDVSPFVTGSQLQCRYKLIGVVNHQGNIHGGHYTADSCGARDGLWSLCSDEVVQPSQQPNFKLAYILFYLRVE